MNTSKVEICGVNTALLPVLNEEQKTQLLLAAKAGNSEARAQMIQGNLRLVLSVVQKFAGLRLKTWTTCSRLGALG